MQNLRSIVGACLSATLLAACGGLGSGGPPDSIRASLEQGLGSQGKPTQLVTGNLYVVNYGSGVSVYGGGRRLLRTISRSLYHPAALAFDAFGRLYVSHQGGGYKGSTSVNVYGRDSTRLLRQFSPGSAIPLAFDAAENLYVGDRHAIRVYANGKALTRKITEDVSTPVALAFDSSGNLYVANDDSKVTVYGQGSGSVLRTISQGVDAPTAMAFDRSGNLYVANNVGGSVTVYAPGSTSVLFSISNGICGPDALAFDGSDNLYVANACGSLGSSVTVYSAGSTSIVGTITQGLSDPRAIAFDSVGYLYAANFDGTYGNTVSVYAPNSDTVLRTISKGLIEPTALSFGP